MGQLPFGFLGGAALLNFTHVHLTPAEAQQLRLGLDMLLHGLNAEPRPGTRPCSLDLLLAEDELD